MLYKLLDTKVIRILDVVFLNLYFSISEMISPTLIMESEVDTDTDTDTVNGDDDTLNIYEEILNNENSQHRHLQSRLSTTSSLYSFRGGHIAEVTQRKCHNHQVKENT